MSFVLSLVDTRDLLLEFSLKQIVLLVFANFQKEYIETDMFSR